MKPSIKWVGGKGWLAPLLAELYAGHEHRRFVELFCGAAAVTHHIEPERALLNDVNPHLINFLRHWRLGLIDPDKPLFTNDEQVYYTNREKFNELIADPIMQHSEDAAALFYYLNRSGFRGLCRFNRGGQFNVPYGHYKSMDYSGLLQTPRRRCRYWEVSCGDFGEARTYRYSTGITVADFIYADPPYDGAFTGYNPNGFTWEDQTRLAQLLREHDGPAVVSNAATDRIVTLYGAAGFTLYRITGGQRISVGDRAPVTELLAVRNLDPGLPTLQRLEAIG